MTKDYQPPFEVLKFETSHDGDIFIIVDDNKNIIESQYKEDADYLCHALNVVYGGGLKEALEEAISVIDIKEVAEYSTAAKIHKVATEALALLNKQEDK